MKWIRGTSDIITIVVILTIPQQNFALILSRPKHAMNC